MNAPAPAQAPTPKPKAQPKPKTAETVVFFESSDNEPLQFDVCGIRAHRDPSGQKCRWRVPVDMAERFARHSHVLSGRIKKIEAPEPSTPAE